MNESSIYDLALGLTKYAVSPQYIVIPPQNVQLVRNLFARLAWQDWWHAARIFGFRSTAVGEFKGWDR